MLSRSIVWLLLCSTVNTIGVYSSVDRHPPHPMSVLIPPPRELQALALWSQNYDTRE